MLFFGYISNILWQLTLCCEHLVDESRDDMRVFKIVVAVGTIHIGWYNTCKLTAVLLMVGPVDSQWKYIRINMYMYIMMLSLYCFNKILDIDVLYTCIWYVWLCTCKWFERERQRKRDGVYPRVFKSTSQQQVQCPCIILSIIWTTNKQTNNRYKATDNCKEGVLP